MKIRTGIGYDVHKLVKGKALTVGGIVIPHIKGSLGHSDGDVLIHAICDALLGAANLRDIGFQFPDSSDQYKGIDSKVLLKKVVSMINDNGFMIENIDSTVILQKPKLKDHIPEMKKALASAIGIPVSDISIKATTTEKLGFAGKEKGIAALANILIMK